MPIQSPDGGDAVAADADEKALAFRFGVSFVLGFLLAFGIGAGVLYAWGQQYDGRVLPGVRVGRSLTQMTALPATYKGRPLADTEVLAVLIGDLYAELKSKNHVPPGVSRR